jgi:hypothetical protein
MNTRTRLWAAGFERSPDDVGIAAELALPEAELRTTTAAMGREGVLVSFNQRLSGSEIRKEAPQNFRVTAPDEAKARELAPRPHASSPLLRVRE